MPELTNNKVESLLGTKLTLGTCLQFLGSLVQKSKNLERISAEVIFYESLL